MRKLHIVFPGGAGGNWLSHLIHCLESGSKTSNTDVNFHNSAQSKSVIISHWPRDGHEWKVFSSKYSFNLYLQGYLKHTVFTDHWNQMTFSEKFNQALCDASYKFGPEWHQDYLQKIDLQYDLMFSDTDQFCTELFELLDQHNINYVKDQKLVTEMIQEFKKTLPSVLDHYDNLDSFWWLCWCFGILHHENLPGNIDYAAATKSDIIDSIKHRQQYFIDYTRPYILL